MKNSALVSIILPVYNVAECLPTCLDSLLSQSYDNIEIICVDDGSTDNSRAVLEAFAAQDCRIQVLFQENAGVGAARNRGLEASKGSCVSFVDPDDWVDCHYVETLIRGLEEYQADLSICRVLKVKAYGERMEKKTAAAEFFRVSSDYLLRHWSLRRLVTGRIYRKKMLAGYRFPVDLKRSEDVLFNLNVICHKENVEIVYIDLPLYYYVLRENSLTHQIQMSEALGFTRWYCEHPDPVESTGLEWILLLTAIKTALSSRYFALFENDGKKTIKEANALLKQLIPGMMKSKNTPWTDKTSHFIMYLMPSLYRIWRLMDDPTLLVLEKKRTAALLSRLRMAPNGKQE